MLAGVIVAQNFVHKLISRTPPCRIADANGMGADVNIMDFKIFYWLLDRVQLTLIVVLSHDPHDLIEHID